MGLQFLADHCVPNSVIQTLRDSNHDVLRLRDILPVESPDAIVIAKALDLGKILLTLNGDFADIVTYPRVPHPFVFGFRKGGSFCGSR